MEEDTKDKLRYARYKLGVMIRHVVNNLSLIKNVLIDQRVWDRVKRTVPTDLYKPRYEIVEGKRVRIIEYPGFPGTKIYADKDGQITSISEKSDCDWKHVVIAR